MRVKTRGQNAVTRARGPANAVTPLRGPAMPVFAALSALVASTCNNVPISSLEKSFSVQVDQRSGDEGAVKIDFLWVIDNSASMCEEQFSLAANFDVFTEKFAGKFDLDQRVAVVGMDMQCDHEVLDGVESTKGRFNVAPASGFPPSCQEKVIRACTTDDDCPAQTLDCEAMGLDKGCDLPSDAGVWACRQAQSASCVTNPNGSVNTECKRRCQSDEECQALFGDNRYICQKPSGNQQDWGCMRPPITKGCPEEVGPVLNDADLALFPCLATIGVNQNKCFKYEQGLASALAALDPEGENAKQITCTVEEEEAGTCRRFLREDAYLVLIFISDEDDCSSHTPINEDDHETCALLDDLADGGPLVPVSHYVNEFKSLKDDPSRVIVASVAGDAIAGEAFTGYAEDCDGIWEAYDEEVANCVANAPDFTSLQKQELACNDSTITEDKETASCESACIERAEINAQRLCYDASKSSKFVCFQTTYACQSKGGRADFGRRYVEFAEGFGRRRGSFNNICSDEGIGPALDDIADTIIGAISKMCLALPIADKENMQVFKDFIDSQTGEKKTVELFEPEDYKLLDPDGGDDCDVDGNPRPALDFETDKAPKVGDLIRVTYKGKPVLTF